MLLKTLLWFWLCPWFSVQTGLSSNVSPGLITHFVLLPVGQAPDLKHHLLRWSSVTSNLATTEQKCSTVPSDLSPAGWPAEQFSFLSRDDSVRFLNKAAVCADCSNLLSCDFWVLLPEDVSGRRSWGRLPRFHEGNVTQKWIFSRLLTHTCC